MKKRLIYILFGQALCGIIPVFGQDHKVVNSYNSEAEITATGSITFTNGFHVPAGANFRAFITQVKCPPLASLPNSNQNYILSSTVKVAGVTDAGQINSKNTCEVNQEIQYLDGLGRPVQVVLPQASPLSRDIVQPIVYDQFGREARKYLPYVDGGTNNGQFKLNAITDQQRFYNPAQPVLAQATKVSLDLYPYRETGFEPSPLNRVMEQGGEGDSWQLSTSGVTGSGHTQKFVYLTNNTVSFTQPSSTRRVAKYTVTIAADGTRTLALADNAAYAENELYMNVSRNENWVEADGRAGNTHEFKDKEGRVVLKRMFNTVAGVLQMLSTYYVYDDLGNLCYVLPPGTEPDRSTLMPLTTLQTYGYRYLYDGRNRLVEKRLPAKGTENLVYNNLDQVVATQDAALRSKNLWSVTKYDAHGRVIMTGSWGTGSVNGGNGTSATSRIALQSLIDIETVFWEKRAGSGLGYNNLAWPRATSFEMYAVNYYDDHNIYNLPSQRLYADYPGNTKSNHTQGLLTATLTRSLHDSVGLWKAYYYDEEGQVIQVNSNNHVGGKDIVNNEYDFVGQVTETERTHNASGTPNLVIANAYSYDHAGRKVDTKQKINTDTEILLSHNEYNELGQLVDKKLHSQINGSSYLQSVDYRYTIRGWLTSINDPNLDSYSNSNTDSTGFEDVFGMSLSYTGGEIKQYNGNISASTWKTENMPQLSYQYAYDKLNRLTAAESYTNGNIINKDRNYSERLTYNTMGNITSLQRFGIISDVRREIDNLAYTYSGNQHTRIDDNSPDVINKVHGFNDGSRTDNEMAYDDNGNLIKDSNKGITEITYSKINMVKEVIFTPTTKIFYEYDRIGKKLRKRFTENNVLKTTTDYVEGIQYTTNGTGQKQIDFIQTEEGRAQRRGTDYFYQYDIKDHLGNARVTIEEPNETSELKVQANSYYAFGMIMPGADINFVGSPGNKYLYNGKELQEETGLYDYGFRMYDPAIGRFTSVDPMAENHHGFTPYNYTLNNPLRYIDPLGLDTVDVNSNIQVQAGDQIQIGEGQYVTSATEDIVINGNEDEGTTVEGVQMALDAVGMTEIPFVSQGAELISAGISFGKGDITGGLIGLGSMIPLGGKAFEGMKIARAVAKSGIAKDFVTKGTKNFSSYFRSEREARNLARTKLGKSPIQIEPNKFRSADGKWQYRAKPGDVSDNHIHLEELNPNTGEVLQNYHLRW